ncbi:MAG: 30S ribosomal protein S6 [Candidatus Margulisiibacteriota bacterium]
MNSYEIMLLFDPNLGEEKIGGIVSKIEGKIKGLGGELEKTDKWGAKNLPVRLQKARKLKQAYYVVIYFKAETSLPGGLQNYLKVTENVIRYSIFRSQVKPPAEIEGAPLEAKGEIEAVDIGEIKGAEEILGES